MGSELDALVARYQLLFEATTPVIDDNSVCYDIDTWMQLRDAFTAISAYMASNLPNVGQNS